MNSWDRENLHFLMDSDEETLEDFYSWATEDDLDYALSLVREAKSELIIAEMEMIDEIANERFDEAKRVLSKYSSISME